MLLAGCEQKDVDSSSTTPEPVSSSVQEEETYTVTFYDQDTVLHTVEVESGKTVEEWDPTSEVTDKTFGGWYIEPSLAHEFDFTVAITKDTNIYGKFTSYVEDTRTWVLAGSGSSSILKSSNWGVVVNEEHKLVKEEVAGENVYAITFDAFVGDQFQFMMPVYNEDDSISWGVQRGGAYVQTLVDEDGTETFSAGGGLGGPSSRGTTPSASTPSRSTTGLRKAGKRSRTAPSSRSRTTTTTTTTSSGRGTGIPSRSKPSPSPTSSSRARTSRSGRTTSTITPS